MKNQGAIDLTVDFCGLRLPNPFLLSSAPPTADAAKIKRAFALGWGGAVTKTIPPDDMVLTDVSPRLKTLQNRAGTILGLENIELISYKPLSLWLDEIREIRQHTNNCL